MLGPRLQQHSKPRVLNVFEACKGRMRVLEPIGGIGQIALHNGFLHAIQYTRDVLDVAQRPTQNIVEYQLIFQ